MKKFLALILVLGIVAALVWLVWIRPIKSEETETPANPNVPVHVGKITRATLRGYVTAYGPVETAPTASAHVAVAAPGVISEVKCAEGQRVEKGALLFQLDPRAADIAVNFAEKTLERQKKLGLGEGTSQKAMQDAEQQLAGARAQQALLKILSPLAGVVARINVRPGEAADLTTVLAEVADLDRLVVSANVPSSEMAAVNIGQPAEVFTGEATNSVPGRVGFVSSQADLKSGTVLVRVELPASCGLRPGQFLKVRIVSDEHKDCLAVPLASVAKDAAGAVKIALVADGKATLKAVKTGLRDGDWVEIDADDLKPDMDIVTEGAYGLVMTEQFSTKIRIVNE